MKNTTFLSFVAVVWLLSSSSSSSSSSSFSQAISAELNILTDTSSLLAFKSHITSLDPNGILYKNWVITNSTSTVCNWVGVSCGSRHQRVTALNLPNMGLIGTIPPFIGNLSYLSYFNLTNNHFHGPLPSDLAKLRRLKVVDFSFNNLSGEVPPWFGMLQNLQRLRLRNNSFTGFLSPSIFNVSTLEYLSLSYNFLQGVVPEEIGYQLLKLKALGMGFNQLSGSIPSTIFNISSLVEINFSNTTLSGSIPEDMCSRLPKLQFLELSWNQLDGQIPADIGNCSELQILSLSYNKFNGLIPRGIGNMSMLQELYLGGNNFRGGIPQEFVNLHRLEIFTMDETGLAGLIPSSIFNVSSLKKIHLGRNQLSGTLPRDMCLHLPRLKFLYFQRNKLTGSLPKEIGNCSLLTELILEENLMTGVIPQEISTLQNMRLLGLAANKLTGPIPAAIFNMSQLELFSVVDNKLSGNLPMDMGLWLPNARLLALGMNTLQGIIPNTISNASKLRLLNLGANRFTGPIPRSVGNLRFLTALVLSENNLTSGFSSSSSSSDQELNFFFTSLSNCRHLVNLAMGGNSLNGILLGSIGNQSTSLEYLDVSEGRIRGSIPSEIGNLTNLAFLYLDGNDLTGFIPPIIRQLSKLQIFDVSSNKLQGSIPVDLCHLTKLGDLELQENKLSGLIPSCLQNVTSLRNLILRSNQLTSQIPPSLWDLIDLLKIDLSSNSLSGLLSPDLGRLKAAILIDLSMNQLSGEIPSTIGGLQNLIQLFLAHNALHGNIPPSVGNLIALEFLDLSNNDLSGVIPFSLNALRQLKYFNVSSNRLRGEIPNGGSFANLTYQSFMSNEALCGAPQFHVPPCHNQTLHTSKMKKMLLTLYILLPIGSVFLVVTFIVTFIRCRRRKEIPCPPQLPTISTHRSIAYHEVLRATEMFSESNLLGNGSFSSVYKGLFSDGMVFAIKVFNLGLNGAFKSFDTECEILRNVRHRNLTKVISSCSTLEFKALVFEYMPNGSLEKWMYSHDYFLDMLQRLDIMIDVACALEYLHYGYSTPIVHCDVKPSNVLLDEDMVGHVSDFGIAKLLGDGESITQTRTLATLGYIAPEYGFEGLVSTRCDVYSYGIMLIEIFTRRRPTDAMFSTGDSSMKQWVENSLTNNAIDGEVIIDANLVRPDEEHYAIKLQCTSSIMELALKCSAELPNQRMNMKDVVVTLKNIRLQFLRSCA